MKLLFATCAAALLATAAFAADPMPPPAPAPTPSASNPVVPAASMPSTCVDLMTKAKAMTAPTDAIKAKTASDEMASADTALKAGDEPSCKTHAQAAIDAKGGM